MKKERDLRILAGEIIPIDEKIKYYSVGFPKRWFEKLTDIYKVIKEREKVTLPIESLNEAIEALPLGIIKINKVYNGKKENYNDWIMSTEPIDSKKILKLIKSWCSIEFIKKGKLKEDLLKKLIKVLDDFKDEDIKIEEKYLDLSKTYINENKTANPDGAIYDVLGNYIAQTIAERQEDIIIGNEIFNFYRHKNELISIPIKEYKKAYYSIKITFNVKTIIGYSKPILLIDTGIRRWSNGKFAESISWKEKTSVLIKYNDNKFNGFTLGCDKIERNTKEKCYEWAEDVKEILEDATIEYLPEIEEVIKNSIDYIGNNKDYTLLISYNNENTLNHPVKKGVSPKERYEVYKQIIEKFKFLQPIANNNYEIIQRRLYNTKEIKEHSIKKFLEELSSKEKELTLEVLYINKNTPNIIFKKLFEAIDKEEEFKKDNKRDEMNIEFNGLKINMKAIMAGDLIEPMEDINSKVNEVIKFLPVNKNLTITIVEMYNKNKYKNKDPKFAIRKGLYKTNRFNQFINTDNIELLEKAENPKKFKEAQGKVDSIVNNIFLELFRQLGIMNGSIPNLKGTPEELEIIGFNLLSTNYNKSRDTLAFPVAVSIRTGEKGIYVKTPINDWMEYSEAILFLGSNKVNRKKCEDEEINKFFRSILNDANENDSLLLVDISNRLNSILKDFQDKNLSVNKVYTEYENVRIMRVKNNLDIPVCVGINNEDDVYFLSGVKQIINSVFYSNEGKTTTYKHIKSFETKMEHLSKEFKVPASLEIVPVKLNKEDDIGSFVYFTHMLRNLNITYDGFSSVPVVNHLAKSFEEVLSAKDIKEENE